MITQSQGERVSVRASTRQGPWQLRQEARAADVALEVASELGTYLFAESTAVDTAPRWSWRDGPPDRFQRLRSTTDQ